MSSEQTFSKILDMLSPNLVIAGLLSITFTVATAHSGAQLTYGSADPRADPETYVSVSVGAALGPMGYAQIPSGITQVWTDTSLAGTAKTYKFPSLLFYISTAPVFVPVAADPKHPDAVKQVQNSDRDLDWMDATFDLELKNQNAPVDCKSDDVQILGLSPGGTSASAITPWPSLAANAANGLAEALSPFFGSVAKVATGSTSGLQLLFQNLFPPKAESYQYAFENGSCTVGWYFRANPRATPPVAILGTQTGLLLLRVPRDVTEIDISARVLTSWTKAPSSYSSTFLLTSRSKDTPGGVIKLLLPDPKASVDFDSIQDLSLFPLLVPKTDVMKIMHISTEADWQKFVSGNPSVTTTPDGKFVTKGSLLKYLDITQ